MELVYFYFTIITFLVTIVSCNIISENIYKYEPYSVLKREHLISLFSFDDESNECLSIAPFDANEQNRLLFLILII